jgi:hypothetical protein
MSKLRLSIRLCLLLGLVGAAQAARSQEVKHPPTVEQAQQYEQFWNGDGDHITRNCRKYISIANANPSSPNTVMATDCIPYLQGVLDGFEAERIITGSKLRLCYPNPISSDQMARDFVKYVDDHPEQLSYPAPFLIWNAMIWAFPCSQPNSHP